MKTAKIWSAAVFVSCPTCDEPFPAPDGSLQHGMSNQWYTARHRCPRCGNRFRLPLDYTVQGNRPALRGVRRV